MRRSQSTTSPLQSSRGVTFGPSSPYSEDMNCAMLDLLEVVPGMLETP